MCMHIYMFLFIIMCLTLRFKLMLSSPHAQVDPSIQPFTSMNSDFGS